MNTNLTDQQREHRRLAALERLEVVDTEPEAEFDSLARAAALVCGTPISLISLIEKDRQWFKANVGLGDLQETERRLSFCTHVIEGNDIMEVNDATKDRRFSNNPFVTGDANIRFYAGVPLTLSGGENVGSLCVIDHQVRHLSDDQREILWNLAQAAVRALEVRRAALHERELLSLAAQSHSILQHSEDAILTMDMDGVITQWNSAAERMFGYSAGEAKGASVGIILTEDQRARAQSPVARLDTPGKARTFRTERQHKDGGRIPVSVSIGPVVSKDGHIEGATETIRDISDILEAQKELEETERRLGQIIEGTRAGTWEWNVASGQNRVNSRWARMLGYSLAELEPVTIATFTALAHPDDWIEADRRLKAHFSGATDFYETEIRMRHKDGHWVWVESRGRVLTRDADGAPEWMFGTHQDISEKKEEEEQLRQSQAFLDRTGQIAGVGGWELDLVEGTVHWSDETCRIHGLEPGFRPSLEEAIGFYTPQSQPVVQAAVEECIATGKGFDLELQLVTAKGALIWIRAFGSAQFEDGRAVRLIGAFQNIDEKVAQRTAIEAINNRFTIATENGRIGVWDADLTTGKTIYSDIWCALLGYTPEELSDDGDRWQDFLHPDDRARALKADAAHIRGEEPFFEEQFRMRHKDGRWIWILDRGEVVARDEEGRPLRMIGTHTDITRQKREEEERLLMGQRMAIAADNGGIGIWEVELEGEVVRWDAWMYRLYGLSEDTDRPLRELWREYTHPDDIERVAAAVWRAVDGTEPMEEEYRIIWSDGSIHHLHVSARLVHGTDGGSPRLVGAAWDVTDEREMALALAEQHELMQVTLTSIGDAVITTDAGGRVRWLNPIAEQMTGWAAEDAEGRPSDEVFHIIHEETRERALDPISTCLELKQIVGLPEDTVLISQSGTEFAIEDSCAPIRGGDGTVLGAVLVFHDVSEQRRLSREMSYRASHDQLTGLINRSEFERRLHKLFERAHARGPESVLLYIDLDRFKIVNDSCGHSVGDELLRKVSQIMLGIVRSTDTLARLGGDEFAVIVENCTSEIALHIAQTICDEVGGFRLVHDGRQYSIGASVGLVGINGSAPSVASVLQAADAACYAAKEEGRNRVHVWKEKDEAIQARLGETGWVSRIEQALREDGFVLYAQKIVPFSGETERTHVELLLRMLGADGGIIGPDAFLPAAERFNLAPRIDRWVFSRALAWMRKAGAGEGDIVSVNLSGQSIGDRAFHKFALGLIDTVGAGMEKSLCIEITETAVISNMAEAMDFIGAMRSRGVLIALDDFGAGASSFSYLKRFSIDFLKIDGQFSQGLIASHPVDEATIRCFVEMARVLQIRTVAECVSDECIAGRLSEMGVDLAQGYAFHLPEPAGNISFGD
ncbi:PAS domain-containing protein [Martelella endophytica]|uniref:PAS domain-containing protein n=1 Tax=Martelella endophytica TaxID=1486262 RepID=UPI000698F57E|nr:PAS domain-containing protein [Martelella endophytica]